MATEAFGCFLSKANMQHSATIQGSHGIEDREVPVATSLVF